MRNLQLTLQQKDSVIEDANNKLAEMRSEKESLDVLVTQTEHDLMQVSRLELEFVGFVNANKNI